MKFKEHPLREQFFYVHPKLRKMLCDVDCWCIYELNKELMITSLIRDDNKGSPHFYKRAADARSWDFTPEELDRIAHYVNSAYPYGDDKHFSILIHDVGQGMHIHFQVREDGKTG